jgi:hypothetical protein
MEELDAETGEKILEPYVRIRDSHTGDEVQVNFMTLSRISGTIIDEARRTLHSSNLYEIWSNYGKGHLLGYVTAENLRKNLPKTFGRLEEMAKNKRAEITKDSFDGSGMY